MTQRLDDLRRKLLEPTLDAVTFEGVTRGALKHGTMAAGESPTSVAAAWPNGVDDFLAFWSKTADDAAVAALAAAKSEKLRIRDRVALGVWSRLEYFAPQKEAARRAAAAIAFPYRHSLAARLIWRSADAIWRGLGDTSTDFNYYSKRGILSGVISTTQARWLTDDSMDASLTRTYLEQRIDNVMQFEKVKSKLKAPAMDELISRAAKLRHGGAGSN
ncbi:MAG: COQ9 family protein [Alphaproteobacteria bacterium]|nr:COQ9 family protein [Alphaproteobacteria bacterium]